MTESLFEYDDADFRLRTVSYLSRMIYPESFTARLKYSPRLILSATDRVADDGSSSRVHGESGSVQVERTRKQILCVENAREACDSIASVLSSYKLTWARSIDGARELYRLQRFSLIFIADQLPDGNGLKLCEEIRNDDYLTPIIIMTRNPELTEVETRIAGAQRLIMKHQPDYLKELRVLADYLSV